MLSLNIQQKVHVLALTFACIDSLYVCVYLYIIYTYRIFIPIRTLNMISPCDTQCDIQSYERCS